MHAVLLSTYIRWTESKNIGEPGMLVLQIIQEHTAMDCKCFYLRCCLLKRYMLMLRIHRVLCHTHACSQAALECTVPNAVQHVTVQLATQALERCSATNQT